MQPAFLLKCFGKTLFSTRYYDITCTYKNLALALFCHEFFSFILLIGAEIMPLQIMGKNFLTYESPLSSWSYW